MHVLIGMPDPLSRGGPAACEPPFVAALREHGVEVAEQTYVFGDNLGATGLATRIRRVVRAALRLRRTARSGRYDVLHLNTSLDTKTVLRDACTLGILGRSAPPVFLKLHGSDPALLTSGRWPVRMLGRRVLRKVASIGVLSRVERRELISAGVPAAKLAVVRNALPAVARSGLTRETFCRTYRLPDESPLLLFISRLVSTKGLEDTIRAGAALRDRGRRFVLCCVGDGPARTEAEVEAHRLGLDDHVRFLGYLPEAEAAAFYEHCDVFAFPTFHDEGLPVVLLNALSAGLPIVTTRTRGAIDYLSEPETCLWVEPHRPEQLADRVEELLDDDALRTAMGERARAAARLFAPEAVAREYLDLYQRLATGSHAIIRAEETSEAVDADSGAPS